MELPDKQRTAKAVGRIPSGVFILTAKNGSQRTGMLASWVQQTSFDPLAVSVAVKKGRPIETLIDESKHFVLNQVGTDATAMFRHFGRGFEPGQDAFAGLNVRETSAGVSLADGIGALSCRVTAKHDVGDHWLYVGEVLEGESDESKQPYVHVRKNGLNY